MGDYRQGSKLIAPIRPTITIPPKSSTEALFMGASPGAMTILSNFLSDNFPEAADFRVSFSELLAGAMASPAGGGVCEGYKENRPAGLAVSPGMFAVSPGFSPSAFLSSPTFFSPAALSPFGMTHQQALAQVTAKAAQPQPQTHLGIQSEHHLPLLGLTLPMTSSSMAPSQHMSELPEASNSERRPPCFPLPVDKPADDGYNWRKYGQKQVKASEYPRSYYRCTNLDCPVKKKVERSFDGHITEIIYKGQHNHDPPQRNKRGKDDCSVVAVGDHGSQVQAGNFLWSGGLGRDQDSAQATSMQLHGPSDSEDSGDAYQQVEDDDDDETNPKIRKTGMGSSDVPFSHKTVTEPKIVVQTKSEVDLLDDGYRWRKYGQKVVKGNPNPRSYYKCTTAGCNVRKHVERASTDLKSVITTYEGKHSHDVPAARGSSTATADTGSFPAKQNAFDDKHTSLHQMDQRSMGLLRLKEEQIVM